MAEEDIIEIIEDEEDLLEGIRPLFGSPGGKTRLSKLIVSYFPDHKTYVEPFCGGAAVFFAKKPSVNEVINDIDPDISFAYQFAKNTTDFKELEKFNWKANREYFNHLKEKKTNSEVSRFHKFIYLVSCSRGDRKSYRSINDGKEIKSFKRLGIIQERLKNACVLNKDWLSLVEKYDAPDTFFYFDPPYPNTAWTNEKTDLSNIQKILESIKGKFILSWSPKSEKIRGFKSKIVEVRRGDQTKSIDKELLISNFDLIKGSDWLSESLKPLQEIKDWKQYDPSGEFDNKVLMDDFRLLASKYSLEKEGTATEYKTVENVVDTAVKTVKRILELDKITFHPDQMKSSSVELMREVLGRIVQGGPYLIPPHGELIFKGKKKAIVKKAKLDKMMQMGILSSGKRAYGFMRTYEPEEIGLEEFNKREDEHRVTEAEVMEADGNGLNLEQKKFWYYKIRDFFPFEEPRKIDIPQGIQRQVQSVRFFESTFLPKDWDIQKLSNAELIKLHSEIHEEAVEFSQETKKPPHEGIIDRHTLILEEMRRRGLEHRPVTELDRLSMKFFTERKVDFNEVVKLSDLMALWQEGFDVRQPFLSFVGGSCVSGWGEDIDIHINWPASDEKFLDAVNFRLQSFLPPEMKEKVHLVADYRGPFTNYIPFATLQVKMIPPEKRKLMKMAEAVLSKEYLREQRVTDLEKKRQADESRKKDSLELFRFFTQVKGRKGFRQPEAFTLDDTIELVKKLWVKNDKFPMIMVDQKFDGFRVQIHSDGQKVKLWSEDGGDVTDRFPSIVAGALAQKKPLIADAEITGERAGKHIGRSDVSGYAHTKGKPEDKPFQANVFDILYHDGKDLHKSPLSERISVLKGLTTTSGFKPAQRKTVSSEGEFKRAISKFSQIPGSEGAMLKLWDSKYPLDGTTLKWMKFKKEVDLDAEVIDVKRVKGTDAYNYLCVIRDGRKRVPVGRTFNVRFERDGKAIQVPVGGIIRVAFVNINKYTDPDDGRVWYNWWSPRAIEYREDRTSPNTVETADRLVKATGGEDEEKPYPKRYEVALAKLKEGLLEMRDYEDWLVDSYPYLYDLDEYEYSLLESIGEDELNDQRRKILSDARDDDVFWDDFISPDLVCSEVVAGDRTGKARESNSQGDVEIIQEQVRDIPETESTKQNVWEHHWRKEESVHLDHRFKVNSHLNGWTIADQPGPGEIKKAKEELGIEGDINSENDAKRLEALLKKNKIWKFDPDQPDKKVLCFPKARQPMAWLKFEGKVEPGTVGATEHGPGFFFHTEKGNEKEFGTQKAFFKEYFEHGNRYKGRWIVRKIPARKDFERVGKGKLVWMAWFMKPDFDSQIPYLLTRRGRTRKDYVPPEGLSGINKEWRDRIPKEFHWWKKGQKRAERLKLMDQAFNWLVDNVEEFPHNKIPIKEAVKDVKWALSKAYWKGPTVVRGMPKVRRELFLDFGEKQLQRYETEDNPIFQDTTSGVLIPENTKPDGDFKAWLEFEGEIPAEHPKNPNEKLPMFYEIEDKGTAEMIERTDNFIHLNFKGRLFKGRKVLKREDPKGEIWILQKSTGPGGKR
jgi:DNA adenine methylase